MVITTALIMCAQSALKKRNGFGHGELFCAQCVPKCKSCGALSSNDHKVEIAVNGHFYCPDHICCVCMKRPNGSGHGKAFCSQCVCDCGMPKTSLVIHKCSACMGNIHKTAASVIEAEKFYSNLTWTGDCTNVSKFEKIITRAGYLNNLESMLLNEITAFFTGAISLSVQTFVAVLCNDLSDGLSGAVSGIDKSWTERTMAAHSSIIESKIETTLKGGDVSVRIAMFFHSKVHSMSIHESATSEPEKDAAAAEAASEQLTLLGGEEIKKDCVTVHCSGVLSIWTQELLP